MPATELPDRPGAARRTRGIRQVARHARPDPAPRRWRRRATPDFHKASVAGIAARAGVAVGNLHYHFGSRRELLRELMGSLVADLMSRLHAADTDEGADFFERQRAGLLVYLDYLRANPGYVRLADEIKLHEPELYRRAVAEWVERMATRIRAGIEQGSLRPMDAAEIEAQAHFLLGARHFLEQMIESDRRPARRRGGRRLPRARARRARAQAARDAQMSTDARSGDPGFDPDALREKYREEREKRLRPDGNDQYVEVTGALAPLRSTTPTSSRASRASRSPTRSTWC